MPGYHHWADPEHAAEAGRASARTRSSAEWHVRRIKLLVDESRREQGLPEHVVDALVLAKVVAVLHTLHEDAA